MWLSGRAPCIYINEFEFLRCLERWFNFVLLFHGSVKASPGLARPFPGRLNSPEGGNPGKIRKFNPDRHKIELIFKLSGNFPELPRSLPLRKRGAGISTHQT